MQVRGSIIKYLNSIRIAVVLCPCYADHDSAARPVSVFVCYIVAKCILFDCVLLCEFLASACRYKVPSASWVYAQGIPAAFRLMEQEVQAKCKGRYGLSLTTDGWKTPLGFSVWVVTAR